MGSMGAAVPLKEPSRMLSDAVLARLRSTTGARVYLAGPMTDRPGWNQAAFDHAEAGLAGRGRAIHNPARLFGGDKDRPRAEYMREDIRALLEAGDVVCLPGWEGSPGARLEVAAAIELGLRVWGSDGNLLPYGCRAVVIPQRSNPYDEDTAPAAHAAADAVLTNGGTVTVSTLPVHDDAAVEVRTDRGRPVLYVTRPGRLMLRALTIEGEVNEPWLATCTLVLG